MKKLLLLVPTFFLLPILVQAATVPKFSSIKPLQGETVVVSVAGPLRTIAKASFDGKPITFFAYQGGSRALLPIGPAAPLNKHDFVLTFKDGRTHRTSINVRRSKFPLIDLGVPETVSSTPNEVVEGFGKINEELASIVNTTTTPPLFTAAFRMPISKAPRFGAPFGELRKTGDSTVRHLGTDFSAPSGTPVVAVNGGKVMLAAPNDLYGNTVVIDHGAGVVSLYLHLSRIDVVKGEVVKNGQLIGAVGETGYAFGPHLHLSIKINGTAVDPIKFIRSYK
jgi:murein DD-endopeptidase MepM/ murein hydrolase activator NlpD